MQSLTMYGASKTERIYVELKGIGTMSSLQIKAFCIQPLNYRESEPF